MKSLTIALLMTVAVAGCTRNASEGKITIQVVDLRQDQPLSMVDTSVRAPAFETAAKVTEGSKTPIVVCLVDSGTSPSLLGTLAGAENCAVGDVDDLVEFLRQEGGKIALVDVNGDGITDTITYDIEPGERDFAEVTTVNTRTDGGYLMTINNKQHYEHGDVIVVRVRGWVPDAEEIHVQLWNNWNGGFRYWITEPRTITGVVDFEVSMTIPTSWPATNINVGASYFTYPISSEWGIQNGDNFVLIGPGGGAEIDVGTAPVNGAILIADGAEAVSSTTVSVLLSAEGAFFFRLGNDEAALTSTPWSPLLDETGTQVPWMLNPGPDGPREVFVQYANTYGVTSEIVSDTVMLDATAIQIRNLQVSPALGKQGTTFGITFDLSEPAVGGVSGTFGGVTLSGMACAGLSCSAQYTATGSEPEGAATIVVRAIDRVGAIDTEQTSTTLDFTPPDTLFNGNEPVGLVASNAASFGLSSSELPATFECSLDDETFGPCPSAVTLSGLADGPHTFLARAVDAAGNVDPTPVATAWTVDTDPPETIIDSAPAAVIGADPTAIAFSSPSLDVARFECRLDGGAFYTCSSPREFALADGLHTFEVRAVDAAGNVDPTPAVAMWTVDSGAPETVLVGPPTGTLTSNSVSLVFYSTASDLAAFECSLNGAGYADCENPLTLIDLNDGDYTFSVRARDLAGNVDLTPAAAAWTINATPPETVITSGPTGTVNSTTAVITFTSPDIDLARFECRLDLAPFATCLTPLSLYSLSAGEHRFEVRAVDTAGNVDPTPATITWVIDLASPQVLDLTAVPNLATTDDVITVEFDLSEPVADLQVTVAGEPATLQSETGLHYTFTYLVTGTEPDGTVAVNVTAVDLAGNPGAGATSVVLDFSPPDTFIGPTVPPAFTNAPAMFVEFYADEPGATFECSINGSAWSACLAPYEETPLVEGPYTFSVRASDAVGIVDPTPAEAVWMVDYTAPDAPDGSRISVTVRPPLTSDQLSATAGAVEPGATILIYADAALSILLATTTAEADGSIAITDIGDDVGDSGQQVYLVARDAAGNTSDPTAVRNPRIPPRVTRNLVRIQLDLDTYGYTGYGNPYDTLRVTWDNSPDGDANAIVTAVSAAFPGLGAGPIALDEIGGGIYSAVLTLQPGTFDGDAVAEITVVGEAGLTTGPVSSANSVAVDVEAPAPPTSVTGVNNGSLLQVSWGASPSIDAGAYRAYHGVGSADTFLAETDAGTRATGGEVESCTQQVFSVSTVDDAGNTSAPAGGGPVQVQVNAPTIDAWGAVGGIIAKVIQVDAANGVELHFGMATEATAPPPWTSPYAQYEASPVAVSLGRNVVSPLKPGTDYLVAARTVKSSCTSAFTAPIPVTTLGFVDRQGGVAICPGCVPWGTIPGRWYFGALGFAVANVGDAWGNDGKDDILTAVPGQTLAVLVSADPFEEVAIVHGYYAMQDIVGAGPNLASAGDVSGNGKKDFLIGSPAFSTEGLSLRGQVRVVDFAAGVTVYTVNGSSTGEQLGYAVSSVGNIGGDAKAEIIAGGIGCMNFTCSDSTATAGIAKVISSNGTVLRTHTGLTTGSFFGVSVHGGVDVTNDGVPDYVVGAPGHVGANAPVGTVHVFSGATGSEVARFTGYPDEKFGFSVRLVRANGTAGGAPRVIVGAPSRNGAAGKVYIYDMSGLLIAALDGNLPEASHNFGSATVSGGDMNGDGVYEIVVGDPNIPLSSQYGNGRAYVYAVDTGRILFEIGSAETDGALGYAMDYVNDYNGDGVQELAVGAPGAAIDGVYNAGRLYVLSIKGD